MMKTINSGGESKLKPKLIRFFKYFIGSAGGTAGETCYRARRTLYDLVKEGIVDIEDMYL